MSLIPAPARYKNPPANPSLVYDTICKVLSERADQVAWDAFTPDDWQLLVMMAETEGVGPLLHWKLKHAKCGVRGAECEVPTSVQQQLKASYYQTAARNALLFRELDRILAAFAEAETCAAKAPTGGSGEQCRSIPVIVLKGAALLLEHQDDMAQSLYPDPALRPMMDLDLLDNLEMR